MTPRPCLSWKPTGRIFKTIGLRWVPTGKIFAFSTNKVNSEPAHGSIVDIPHIHACKQTLGLSAAVQASVVNVKWCLLKITLQAPFLNVKKMFDRNSSSLSHQCQMTFVHISSGLVLHQMTSDHNRSELGIHDHSNEQSSSKLVPKSCSLSKQDSYITTRVGITIPPSHSNAEDNRNLSHLSRRYTRYLLTSHRDVDSGIEHPSDTNVFTMKIEILLEPASNKLLVGDLRDSI
ncbi:hypothetical protein Tco_0791619 [Tanacetum coccineum]